MRRRFADALCGLDRGPGSRGFAVRLPAAGRGLANAVHSRARTAWAIAGVMSMAFDAWATVLVLTMRATCSPRTWAASPANSACTTTQSGGAKPRALSWRAATAGGRPDEG